MKEITERNFESVIRKECSKLKNPPPPTPDVVYWLLSKKCFKLALKMCDKREQTVRTQIQKDLDELFK